MTGYAEVIFKEQKKLGMEVDHKLIPLNRIEISRPSRKLFKMLYMSNVREACPKQVGTFDVGQELDQAGARDGVQAYSMTINLVVANTWHPCRPATLQI